jgi:hypothetical protein
MDYSGTYCLGWYLPQFDSRINRNQTEKSDLFGYIFLVRLTYKGTIADTETALSTALKLEMLYRHQASVGTTLFFAWLVY